MPRSKSSENDKRRESDIRRALTLVLSAVMLLSALAAWWFGDGSSGRFAAAAAGRIGLVLAALWLAWPSLKRPAKWLPASAPVVGVIALIVVAAQPRLILPAIPIVAGLITLSAFVKVFRGR